MNAFDLRSPPTSLIDAGISNYEPQRVQNDVKTLLEESKEENRTRK